MSLARNIARNTAIQLAGRGSATLIAVIAVSLMLRYLGVEGFGAYTTVVTFLSLFSVVGDMGMYLVVTREIARREHDDSEAYLSQSFGLKLTTSGLLTLLACLTIWFLPYAQEVKIGVLIGGPGYFFIMAIQVLVGVFQKHFAMHRIAIAEVCSRLIWLGGVAAAIVWKRDLLFIMAVVTLSQAVFFFLLYGFSRRFYRIRFGMDWQAWKGILRTAAPLALSIIFNLVYFKVGTLILTLVDTQQAVGIYGAAQKVLENLIAFAAVFAGIMFPLLSRGAAHDRALFAKAYRRGIDLVAIVMVPLVVGTLFAAEPVIVLFGGVEYLPSAGVLHILIFSTAAIFFANLTGNAVVALGKEKPTMWVYFGVAVFSLIANLILIPRFSYTAAAIVSVISETTVMIATMTVVWKAAGVLPPLTTAAKAVVASSALAAAFLFGPAWTTTVLSVAGKSVSVPSASFWAEIVVGMVGYVLVLMLLGAVSPKVIRDIVSLRKEKEVEAV